MTVAWSIALALVVVGVAYAVGRAGPGGATDAGATPDRSGASAYSVAATAPPGRLATARARLRASPTASPPALGGSDALASRRTRIAASTGAAGASAGVARIVATPVDAARAGLVSATPPPAATATPPPPDAGAPRRAPTSRSSPPQPSPATATETPQPAPPGVTIGGAVTADGAAIVGATVQVWRAASAAACAPGDLTRTATAATDGQGRFTVIDLPPGIYLVSAEGGPTCLPRRWCAGAVEPAVDAPCAAARLALERAGDATGLANVAVEGLVEGCPNEEGPGG